MAKTSVKHKKPTKKTPAEIEQQKKQQDAATFRVMTVVVAAIISVFIIRILENMFNNADTSWGTYYFFCGIGILGAALIAAGIVLLIANIFRLGTIKKLPFKLIVSGIILAISGWLVFRMGSYAFDYLVFIYPAYAAFFLIYFIFQREFFFISILCGADIFLLFGYSRILGNGWSAKIIISAIATIVISALLVLLFKRVSKTEGMIHTKGEGILVFRKEAVYYPVYITCGAIILTTIISVLVGALTAYIFMFIMIALLIGWAVYYATKLL